MIVQGSVCALDSRQAVLAGRLSPEEVDWDWNGDEFGWLWQRVHWSDVRTVEQHQVGNIRSASCPV